MDNADHCDSSNDAKKSLIAGSEISTPDVSRRDLHDSLTAEKISVGAGSGIIGGATGIASFVEDIIPGIQKGYTCTTQGERLVRGDGARERDGQGIFVDVDLRKGSTVQGFQARS